jgi:hypothetical protein
MSLDTWQNFLTEARKKKKTPKRKSGAGLERALSWFLDKGPQKKGGYPKKRRPNFKKKKFNDISAPPGAPGGLEEDSEGRPGYRKRIDRYIKDRDSMLKVGGQKNTPPFTQKMGSHVTFDRQLEEEVEEESFEVHDELQPEFWRDNKLWPDISDRLKEIVNDFLEGLEIEVGIEDLRLTGSLANYNWSEYSDVDLHLVVDFEKIDEDIELVKAFFDSARMRWNGLHDIKLYGFEVEIYVENVGDSHHSTGIYSILFDRWLVEPNPQDVEIDFATARKKSDDIMTQINLISYFGEDKPAMALKSIERLKEKIRNMRKAGLTSPQREYSSENIAFKILRRESALAKLNDLKYNIYDSKMSMSD